MLAKEYEKKVIALAPNDPEAYYTIGVVDWMQVLQECDYDSCGRWSDR